MDTPELSVIVTMRDVRKTLMCSDGSRAFAKRHNIDWAKFLREGISSDQLPKDDWMVQKIVEAARGR